MVRFQKDETSCQSRPFVAIYKGMISTKVKKVGSSDLDWF